MVRLYRAGAGAEKAVNYSITIPPNSTADFSVPDNYKIKKVRLPLTNESVSTDKKSDGTYHLPSGKFEIELVRQ